MCRADLASGEAEGVCEATEEGPLVPERWILRLSAAGDPDSLGERAIAFKARSRQQPNCCLVPICDMEQAYFTDMRRAGFASGPTGFMNG